MNHPIRHGLKAQMEAFGLAVIVMLIILGFYIFVKLSNTNPTVSNLNTFIPDQLANNFVNSAVNVNVQECSATTLSDLMKACATGEDMSARCNGDSDSCKLAHDTMEILLKKSLAAQQYAFNLSTTGMTGHEINIINGDCTNRRHGQIEPVYIPLFPRPGEISLYLSICN